MKIKCSEAKIKGLKSLVAMEAAKEPKGVPGVYASLASKKDASEAMPSRFPDVDANPHVKKIYAKYHNGLKTYLARRVKSEQDADDILQDVYLRLLKHKKIDSVKPSFAFLCTIASNIMKDRVRYQHVRKIHDHIPITEVQVSSPFGTPEQVLNSKEGVAKYWRAFEKLNAKQRKAFVMHRLEGLTYKEIALEMGTSGHMVKKYITGAVIKLRKMFG